MPPKSKISYPWFLTRATEQTKVTLAKAVSYTHLHYGTVGPNVDDHQPLTFERDRRFSDSGHVHMFGRCGGEAGLIQFVDILWEVDRGDVHLLGELEAAQIDDVLAGACLLYTSRCV